MLPWQRADERPNLSGAQRRSWQGRYSKFGEISRLGLSKAYTESSEASQTSFMMCPSTSFPWSLEIDKGVPKRVNTCWTNTWPPLWLPCFGEGNANVYESIHVRIQICLFPLLGLGSVKSIYHRLYGAPTPQASTAPASSVFLGGIRCIPDIFGKNAPYLPSTRTNKTFILFGPTFFGSRSVHPLFQRGTIAVLRQLCFVVAAAAGSSILLFSDYLCYETQVHYTPITRPISSSSSSLIRFRSEARRW